jgi:hypothetical protein
MWLNKHSILALTVGAALLLAAPLSVVRAAVAVPSAVDLALNQPYTVTLPMQEDQLQQIEEANWPNLGQLTNGQSAAPGLNHGWVGFYRQDDRTITVNLGRVDTVHTLNEDFLQGLAWGITVPENAIFSVSINGTNWQRVGDVMAPVALSEPTAESVLYQVSGLNIQAQYVRVQFPTDGWVFSDQIQAIGNPGVQLGSVQPVPTPGQWAPDLGYANLAESGGVNDLLVAPLWLAPNYNQTTYPWNLTPSQWLPMVAYLNPNGQIENWLFKSVLAWPGAGELSVAAGSDQADWQEWLNRLFNLGAYSEPTDPTELTALNQAVGTAKQALGDQNYQEDVVITIPYPSVNTTDWGTLNGQTLNFATSTVDREQAVDWFIQQVEQAWQNAGYSNLHLSGFYWDDESISPTIPGEEQLVEHTAQVIHSQYLSADRPASQSPLAATLPGPLSAAPTLSGNPSNGQPPMPAPALAVYGPTPGGEPLSAPGLVREQRFYWIPSFEAVGYKNWRQLGFDVAMMQPNYAFTAAGQVLGPERLTEAAELAHHYGLGLEMEFPYAVLNPAAPAPNTNTYLQYQDAAIAYGYSQKVPLAWYQNTQGILNDYLGKRVVYDQVDRFMQGAYSPVQYVESAEGTYSLEAATSNLPQFQPVDIPSGLSEIGGQSFPWLQGFIAWR